MNILLAGGAGDVGTYLCDYFYQAGDKVVSVDRQQSASKDSSADHAKYYREDVANCAALKKIISDHEIDVIFDLAWSFAADPRTLFGEDIIGQINLMEAAASGKVKRFLYASTAGVYGTPALKKIVEEQACRPELARKPLYSVAKLAAEQLALAWGGQHDLPVTVLRFWWAFGDSIGGKHLRQLVKAALRGEPIKLVIGEGGAFVSMADLAISTALVANNKQAVGQTYNLGSLFITWQEISAMIIELTNSTSQIILADSSTWNGPAFLGETWHLSWEKATREWDYHPSLMAEEGKAAFRRALSHCIDQVRKQCSKEY